MRKLLLLSYEWSLRAVFTTVILLTALAFFLTLTDFPKVEPYIYPLQLLKAKPIKVGENLWMGGYMEEKEFLSFLKKNSISVVISLLDWDMLHEKKLLDEEERLLRRVGVKIYSVPMKPFLKEETKLRKVKRIIRLSRGRRIYVHSYLGRVRVNYVKEALNAQ